MRNIIIKRALFFGFICLVLLSMNACTSVSTTPHFYTSNVTTGFEILGEVVYESAEQVGFIELLRAARRRYRDCDYVIDVMIDKRETIVSFFGLTTKKNTTWVMRGTAIKYKR